MKPPVILIEDLTLDVNSAAVHQSLKGFLSIKNRKKRTRIIDIQSLVFHHGDKVCVVGRNGNGKTTFMRLLARIYQPSSGKISGSYVPMTVLASGIGLDEDLTLLDNIKYSVLLEDGNLSAIKPATADILEFCEISYDEALKQYRHFSTGYKSRISFAIATRKCPDVLILDEVLGGGDQVFMPKARKRLLDKISQSRLAFVATHSPSELQGVCNKLIYLSHGKVTYFGSFSDGLAFFEKEMNVA